MRERILLVKVGSEDRPATKDDLIDMENKLRNCIKNNDNIIVTHHAVQVEYIDTENFIITKNN